MKKKEIYNQIRLIMKCLPIHAESWKVKPIKTDVGLVKCKEYRTKTLFVKYSYKPISINPLEKCPENI